MKSKELAEATTLAAFVAEFHALMCKGLGMKQPKSVPPEWLFIVGLKMIRKGWKK